MRFVKISVAFVLVAASLGWIPARAAAGFKVGTSVVDITPNAPQYLGGFGQGDPVGGVNAKTPDDPSIPPEWRNRPDPLQVRAFAISNGTTLVEFAIVDTQGYFSGNQEGPYGSRDARLDAAAALNKLGFNVTDANLIVSSTHSHAAPTIMGIWGPVDPAYLRQVHDGTVAALVDAASQLRPAELSYGDANVAALDISSITQTDGYQGWPADGDLPVLVARDPDTRAIVGLYANVPAHADIVNGAGHHEISADHIGVARQILDEQLGTTSVIAMGTLGRQETIVQVGGFRQALQVGTYTANEIERAIGHAIPITSDTLATSQQYLSAPTTNPLLAGLNYGNVPAGPQNLQAAWTIDRAVTPPYVVGANLGSWVTAFRIGDIVYATEPGEAFPEVSTGIRRAFDGAAAVRVIGMAQDQLGYYFPPESYGFTILNCSDHQIYNSSLLLGELNVELHALNSESLGFRAGIGHESNQLNDLDQIQHAGVQFFPVPREQEAGKTFVFDARTSESMMSDAARCTTAPVDDSILPGGDFNGSITWDFGDGTPTETTGEGLIPHTYAQPGQYTVRAAITDPSDKTPHAFVQTVFVDPRLTATVADDGQGNLIAGGAGGSGTIISAHWDVGGDTSTGLTHANTQGDPTSLVVTDSAGNTASVRF